MAFFGKKKRELQAALDKLEAAEKRIIELEADFQAIEASSAVLVLTPDGLIERVSDAFLALLGYKAEELTGKHHRVLCESAYTGSEEYIVFWRSLVIGVAQNGRFLNLDASGQGVWLKARYLPVRINKGMVRRILVMVERAEK
ncbi:MULTISPECIES: PAS domain-containing protein [unclassified Marinobacter]|jgi:methyl-accepting chemotaxis protein|uniref:PAS domain-containing protein n=1 Tax=unclassified Marinobacter TaxID=83889 RepID=UPI00200CBF99|nr:MULTISPECIES: PAS domain-containing protein [unclassified Marinobacter]UQG55383.1 PAS domain-containing protein [Marinobacter sp. M4C]UQG64187.1 PAS domain-containing protein [Marinobacter sp. M2C]UQG68466.1 PAS domain-containing protein [Marinobacter sp. M1C]